MPAPGPVQPHREVIPAAPASPPLPRRALATTSASTTSPTGTGLTLAQTLDLPRTIALKWPTQTTTHYVLMGARPTR